MGFDRKEDVLPLFSFDSNGDLFVWSEETLGESRKKKGDLKNKQLVAISYMWKLCDSLLMAKSDNVSQSPSFESIGLTVNKNTLVRP